VLQDGIDQLLRKPAAPEAPTAPNLPTATAAPAEAREDRLKVLVVEDDPSLLRLYQFHISRWPMSPQLHIVSNAFAALLMMGREPPDLLISDLHMPGMDGFTMLKVLCEAPALKGTRIVVVSGLSPADVAVRGGLPQGIEMLSKPIPFDQLLSIANAVLINKKSLPPHTQDSL
jgi:DNA-binding response OmpR family regulator